MGDNSPFPRSNSMNCECGKKYHYHERYDAYYCDACNAWKEVACDDPICPFCRSRPEKPIIERQIVK